MNAKPRSWIRADPRSVVATIVEGRPASVFAMSASPVYRPHAESPAIARLSAFETQGAWSGLGAHRFEVVSRGDFVNGILYLPPGLTPDRAPESGASPVPLVMLQHGLAGSKDSPYLECAARWVREGFAVAMIDLPLHGERSSPKLSERLVQGIDRVVRNENLDAETHALVEEFARQSTSDLVRSLDALADLGAIDAGRIGYVGFSLGAIVGTYLLAHDPRPSVAVLALAGGERGPAQFDPVHYIGRATSCPVLVVAADDDKRVSAASSRALLDAAREPKEIFTTPGDHGTLPGVALRKIQSFLQNGFAR
jgi:dienelactone hydrolase